ncbi:hypothetical protein AB4144_11920, partial [Rhizobiaceae sp. 2RAB30]
MNRIRSVLFAIAGLLALTAVSVAQSPPSPPAPSAVTTGPSQADRQEMLRLLGDPRMMDWLRSSAEAGMAEPSATARHSLR